MSPPIGKENTPPNVITSRDNKWLKSFRAALRGAGLKEGDPIGIEGPKLVEEALRWGLEVEALLVSASGEGDLERILKATAERPRILRTSDRLFAGVAGTDAPQGVAALVKQPSWGFDDILRGAPAQDGSYKAGLALVVALVGVQDPGNVGTIVRSAEAFGATGVVTTRGTADPWSPKALRSSAGSALRLPVLRGMAIPILLTQLRVAEVRILAATSNRTVSGENAVWDFNERVAIFVGNEGAGLPTELECAADARISIPISETVESLNAAVAASLLLYEAARHRRKQTQK
jgi:TrmH family RNA methyltransferase